MEIVKIVVFVVVLVVGCLFVDALRAGQDINNTVPEINAESSITVDSFTGIQLHINGVLTASEVYTQAIHIPISEVIERLDAGTRYIPLDVYFRTQLDGVSRRYYVEIVPDDYTEREGE